MSGRRLKVTTIVRARAGDPGESFRIFGPDDEDIPDWAAKQIGDHCWADGAADEPDGDGPPPRGGAGSGADAWATYAQRNGVEVEDGASREDIIAALDDAGVATE